jgi:hypothetical protein
MIIDDVIVRKCSDHVELDVRVRNPQNYAVNITRADLDVIEREAAASAYKPSASYDLLLASEHNSIPVAHVLQANEVDSFVIRVGFTPFNSGCGFRAQIVLHYNQNLTATSTSFTFGSFFESD